jgi:hypothetical protein
MMVTINIDRTGQSADTRAAFGLSHTATAYGIGAAVAVIFNTLLAWLKDSYESLNTAMAHTLGHHWTTHGVAVVLVFFLVGYVLSRKKGDLLTGYSPIYAVVISVVASGLGLLGWFLFV